MKNIQGKPRLERIVFIAIVFLIQIAWFVIIFKRLIDYAAWMNVVLIGLSLVIILYIIRNNDSPAYRTSWIMLIGLFPIFGGLLYFLTGNKRPAKGMRNKLYSQQTKFSHVMEEVPDAQEELQALDSRIGGLSQYLRSYDNMPVYSNTDVKYFPSGESMMNDLIYDLKQAKKFIFIEFFIVEYGVMFDAIFDVLKEKAREGVDVRFIYDDFGSITRLPVNFDEQCEALGIKALKFNPVKPVVSLLYNTRDHRKYVIIDGKIGYTGGVNIADEYINVKERFGYWKDTMIRMDGPATWNLTVLFLNMWNAFYPIDRSYDAFYDQEMMVASQESLTTTEEYLTEGFVQPFGDSPLDEEALGENVYRDMLNYAVDYVYIYTPYLVISYELQTALEMAAKRGVDVRLMTPGIPDKKLVFRMTRSYYRPLLKAGVKIYEYSPGFLHAKSMVVDDVMATVGTINFDYRSLYLHFETSTQLYYHPVIADIKADFLDSQAQSRQITLADTRTSFLGEIWDSILRLIAPFV